MLTLAVLLDVAGRLGLVVALLFLFEEPGAAAGVALVSSLVTAARYVLRGTLVARWTRVTWSDVLEALRSKGLQEVERLREDQAGATLVFDAVREVSLFRSITVPDLLSSLLVAIGLAVLLAVRVSWLWLGVGLLSGSIVLAALLPALRRQRAAQLRSFRVIGPVARDFQALLGAAAELRVSGSERGLMDRVLNLVGTQADAEQAVSRYGALHAVVPAVIAGVATFVPRGWLDALGASGSLFDLGILAASLLTTLLTLVRTLEGLRRAKPYRDAIIALLATPRRVDADEAPSPVRAVALEQVSVNHPGSDRATPAELSFRLDRGGVAVVGPNGSGKSTAIKLVLGLLEPTTGRVLINDQPSRTASRIRGRVAYLPQRPYLDRGEPLSFHLRLVGVDPAAPWLSAALDRAGVGDVLRKRAPTHALDAPISSLSGGEIQRFLLARTLGQPADLVVLDEPEVALDEAARASLRSWLEEIARDRLVLVVAHDEVIVPASYTVVRLQS